MATVTITISLKGGSTRLHLRDSEGHSGPPEGFSTQVNRGDLVVWQLEANSGIDEISAIRAKSGSFTLFNNSDPKPRTDGSWAGKVKDDAAGANSYDIDYRIGSNSFSEDPEITIKP
ncbi:hypothetical protein [Cesiribacter andamanensis]|uniref:Uncharacterized protein n=1 Tax=Cesiribacter andamanensis AMV16 TaxID=1279009 RepID=M7N0W1_9BACT|nr:hypothetical protein [Cesiribacter andamanensis]EMR00841.1 hypothetical protein ADICEAN_04038 [Cesiribacter andamanensis AMV16]